MLSSGVSGVATVGDFVSFNVPSPEVLISDPTPVAMAGKYRNLFRCDRTGGSGVSPFTTSSAKCLPQGKAKRVLGVPPFHMPLHAYAKSFGLRISDSLNNPIERYTFDENMVMTREWGVRALPTSFIVDMQGRIVYFAEGERDFAKPEVVDWLRRLIPSRRTEARSAGHDGD